MSASAPKMRRTAAGAPGLPEDPPALIGVDELFKGNHETAGTAGADDRAGAARAIVRAIVATGWAGAMVSDVDPVTERAAGCITGERTE